MKKHLKKWFKEYHPTLIVLAIFLVSVLARAYTLSLGGHEVYVGPNEAYDFRYTWLGGVNDWLTKYIKVKPNTLTYILSEWWPTLLLTGAMVISAIATVFMIVLQVLCCIGKDRYGYWDDYFWRYTVPTLVIAGVAGCCVLPSFMVDTGFEACSNELTVIERAAPEIRHSKTDTQRYCIINGPDMEYVEEDGTSITVSAYQWATLMLLHGAENLTEAELQQVFDILNTYGPQER